MLNTHEIMFCLQRTTFRISPPKDQVFAQQSGCEMRDVGAVLEACLDSACIEHLAGHCARMHRTIALKRLKSFQDNYSPNISGKGTPNPPKSLNICSKEKN